MLCLLFPLYCGAEQFVELTAEFEITNWYYFSNSPKMMTNSHTTRCLVCANTWMIEDDSANGKQMYWFTGTNIIRHAVIAKKTPDSTVESVSSSPSLAFVSPRVEEQFTRVYASVDGDPNRPVHVADPLAMPGKISWLAFCSGSFFKRDGRQIFPPDDTWKEYIPAPSGFQDETAIFEDGLGLPKSIKLFALKDQLLFEYQVRQSTNVLGWNFPLEFYCVQYRPTGTNLWKLHLTAKGKLTSIKEGTKPEIPAEVWKAVEK